MNYLVTSSLLGIICFFFNKPIAKILSDMYVYPIRAVFGEKKWILTAERYFFVWMRITLYSGVLISLIVIFLEISG